MGGSSIWHWILLLLIVAIGIALIRRRRPSDRLESASSGRVSNLGDAPKVTPENYTWRDIDTIILGVPCAGCDEMEGYAAEAPGLRTCKLCGRRIELEKPWHEFVDERIKSGHYHLVGNGRTIMMNPDLGAAIGGMRPQMVQLFGLDKSTRDGSRVR